MRGSRLRQLPGLMVVGLALLGTLLPFYWLFVLSSRPQSEAFSTPSLTVKPVFDAYRQVLSSSDYQAAMMMSAKTVGLSVLLTLLVAIPAAYAFTRFRVRARSGIMGWLLIAYLLPDFLIAIPLYAIYQNLHLYDTAIGLALAYQVFMAPLAMWLLLRFFAEVPVELGEAAYIDGCSHFQTLVRVYLPLVAPGVATTAILVSIWVWNEVTIALSLTLNNPTVPIAVSAYRGYASIEWDQMCAAAIIGFLPVLVFAAFVQRHIVRGLTTGVGK